VECLIVEKGYPKILIDGEESTIHQGEGCFFNSFSVHSYTKNSDAYGFILLGEKELFDEIFSSLGGVIPTVFKYDDFNLLQTFWNLYTKNDLKDEIKTTLFKGIVWIILSQITLKNELLPAREIKTVSFIRDLLLYAETNFSLDLSINALSKKFGYTREHFSRLVKKFIKEPWGNYVARMRVKKAALLLKDKSLLVSTIAFSCGFESTNSFYRAYKTVFGKPPRK
jgi:YesN/AraC family two-component response regulator